ncbi:hypothetical protein GGR57DRAFT_74724 [Xylariaceae sp. FL1272]|nr:hypothetical protein GGR57DRAFT_74724 [Xylariaceae sp. FL1272]
MGREDRDMRDEWPDGRPLACWACSLNALVSRRPTRRPVMKIETKRRETGEDADLQGNRVWPGAEHPARASRSGAQRPLSRRLDSAANSSRSGRKSVAGRPSMPLWRRVGTAPWHATATRNRRETAARSPPFFIRLPRSPRLAPCGFGNFMPKERGKKQHATRRPLRLAARGHGGLGTKAGGLDAVSYPTRHHQRLKRQRTMMRTRHVAGSRQGNEKKLYRTLGANRTGGLGRVAECVDLPTGSRPPQIHPRCSMSRCSDALVDHVSKHYAGSPAPRLNYCTAYSRFLHHRRRRRTAFRLMHSLPSRVGCIVQ